MTRLQSTSSHLWRGSLLCLALLTGCSATGPVPTATAQATTPTVSAAPTATPRQTEPVEDLPSRLSIWVAWSPQGVTALNELIRAFQSDRPGADFAVAYVRADELRQTLEQAAAEGQLPSLFFAPSLWGPELHQAGMIRDLADQPVDQIRAIVHSLAWSQAIQGDSVLGLPVQLDGNVLYRNRELAPVPAATVEGLVESSRGFRGTQVVGMNLDFEFSTIVPFGTACGGQLIQPGSLPDLRGSLGPCWLALLQELSRAGPVAFNSDLDREAFRSGQAGWLIDSTELYETLAAELGQATVAVDPWPIYEASGEPLAGFVWGENLYFRNEMEPAEIKLAWEFATFLLSAESQQALSSPVGGGNLPVHAGSFPLVGVYGQMYQALLGGVSRPLDPPAAEIAEILERAARAVAVQGTSVELALRRALEELADV
jgi:ABC-type glycerol-3-phosphate transport system substrate-binding protein